MHSVFHIVLIKPTHYDEQGYPIQWNHNWIPSNSLACLYALALDCRDKKTLGKDIEIKVHAFDEICQHIHFKKLLKEITKPGNRTLICMVGVQSNQFPRAMDISVPFLNKKLPVIVGGIHVSGCLALLNPLPNDLQEAQSKGISFFAGEAEQGRFEQIVRDAYSGSLKPIYNYLNLQPRLEGEPTPILPSSILKRTGFRTMSVFDAGRGCPFSCSFCTIINVHGNKSRFRSADDIEHIILKYHKLKINNFFITDDNFARNSNWEVIFDRMIALKKQSNINIKFVIQVDAQAHRIPRFIEKAASAGATQVFIGLESVNPKNLVSADKKHNRIEDYKEMMLAWKHHKVLIICAYIIGFPDDTPESLRRDVEYLKYKLPIDIVYFTLLEPLPGSIDHKRLYEQGAAMDQDMNKYDTTQPVMAHPKMTIQELKMAYLNAWKDFYTIDHIATILRRMFATGSDKKLTTANRLAWFSYFYKKLSIHPIDGGFMPIRKRKDRRPGFPLENPLIFYPKNLIRSLYYQIDFKFNYLRKIIRLMWQIKNDPSTINYIDEAIAELVQSAKYCSSDKTSMR